VTIYLNGIQNKLLGLCHAMLEITLVACQAPSLIKKVKGAAVEGKAYFKHTCENTNLAAILVVLSGISPQITDLLFKGQPRRKGSHFSAFLSSVSTTDLFLNTAQRDWMVNDFIVVPIQIAVWFTDERVSYLFATTEHDQYHVNFTAWVTGSHSESLSRNSSERILSCAV
jgi:hypothetical protein